MTQIDGAGQQDTDNQNAEALQAALAQREVTAQAQPQGGSDVPSHQNSDPIERRIGNSTAPSGSYQKTSCTVVSALNSAARGGGAMLVTDVLKELGYAALEAVDGRSALPILESNTRIDLLVSDVG